MSDVQWFFSGAVNALKTAGAVCFGETGNMVTCFQKVRAMTWAFSVSPYEWT